MLCIKSVMANSKLTMAIQASKSCVCNRKDRNVLDFGKYFLRGLKYWAFNYVVTG